MREDVCFVLFYSAAEYNLSENGFWQIPGIAGKKDADDNLFFMLFSWLLLLFFVIGFIFAIGFSGTPWMFVGCFGATCSLFSTFLWSTRLEIELRCFEVCTAFLSSKSPSRFKYTSILSSVLFCSLSFYFPLSSGFFLYTMSLPLSVVSMVLVGTEEL